MQLQACLLVALSLGCQARKTSMGNGKITDGTEVAPHSIPHQVAFYSGGYFCGGSIIDKLHVLTAAHCCHNGANDHVVIGAHWLSKVTDKQRFRVATQHVHEEYIKTVDGYPLNDICLLTLGQPLQFDQKVNSTTLPSPGHNFETGTQCFVSGWGRTQEGGSRSDVLMHADLHIVSDDVCMGLFQHTGANSSTVFCAGGYSKDSCQGDSGGPLVCDGVHTGVVSFGIGCGRTGFPGAYARTSSYVDWINKIIAREQLP